MIRKLIIGLFLVVAATGITVFIKETLDTKDPESALPIISIVYEGAEMQGVYRAGYTWSFFTTIEDRQAPSLAPEDLPLTPTPVLPGRTMEIKFSNTPSELRVWRATGRYSSDYVELTSDTPSVITTPSAPGVYVYRLKADWGARGTIQYFFALDVQAQ